MHIVTQGLVLRETNYKETDKILTVLTREGGKRTVKARGCRRRNSPLAASAQLLVWSDMTLFEYRDYISLNEAEALELFWGVRRDVEKLNKPPALVKAAFELRLLCVAGYEPLLDACALCGEEAPAQPRLDLGEGVLCCAACGEGEGASRPLDAVSLAAMRHVVYGDPKRLFSFSMNGESMALMARACEDFLLTQLDRGFRTLDFYKQLDMG